MEWIHTVQKADELLTKAYADKIDLLMELSKLNMREEWYDLKEVEINAQIMEKDKEIDELTKVREQLYELFR